MKLKIFAIALIVLQTAIVFADENELEYYAVFMDGTKIGHATHSRAVSAGQVTTTDFVSMTLKRLGQSIQMKTRETCVETIAGQPLSFIAEQDMGIVTMKTQGIVSKNGSVRTQTSSLGAVQESDMIWPAGALMAEGLRLAQLQKKLHAGTSYDLQVFSPGLMTAVKTTIKIGPKSDIDLLGRILSLTKVDMVMNMPGAGEIITTTYVDDQLRCLKSIMPIAGMNIELLSCEKEFALSNNQPMEIIDKMFLASPQDIENVGQAKSITYYIKPLNPNEHLVFPQSDNQIIEQLDGNYVKVTIVPAIAPAGDTFPYKGTDKKLIEETRPTRFLQSDDPNIIALAKQAIGLTTDSAEAAKKIEAFVAKYVKNVSFSVGYASASEVAENKRGDCSEFAVLCAAMCRSIGIPARVTVGVAYVNDFESRTGFGGHAWVEAFIGGKWIGLDPAFMAGGLGKFDAGHIALASGSGEPADFFNLASTLGKFKIEKLTVER